MLPTSSSRGVRTRRAAGKESQLLAARNHAAASGPLVRLSEDLLFAVLSFCDGATLGRLERTCRLFGLPSRSVATETSAQTLPERIAALQMGMLGLGAPSLWAQCTGASHKHQLWRTTCPTSRIRRFPVQIPIRGGSPAFGPHGELWMADYMGKCVKQIGWENSRAGGRFTVHKTFRLPVTMGSTVAAVAVSSDGLRLAITVQPPYYQDGHGSHGFIILCARTGATLTSYLDGELPGGIDEQLEYPSAVEWLRGGMYAGQLAIADYNNGRVQIRNSDTGTLEYTVTLECDNCVSGVAELSGDKLAVVPHASDAVAVFDFGEMRQNPTYNLSNLPTPRWFGRQECGMPIAASGVDDGQTLAVSDGAHRCVLFFEQVASTVSRDGRLRPRRENSRAQGPVSVAVDYCSGEVVNKRDRPRPREFGRRPPRQWRRLHVDAKMREQVEDARREAAGLRADLMEFGLQYLLDEDDVDEHNCNDGEDTGDQGALAESDDEDSEDDDTFGQFGIWTSLGFDHARGDMVVSDSGTRYSDGSVWLS